VSRAVGRARRPSGESARFKGFSAPGLRGLASGAERPAHLELRASSSMFIELFVGQIKFNSLHMSERRELDSLPEAGARARVSAARSTCSHSPTQAGDLIFGASRWRGRPVGVAPGFPKRGANYTAGWTCARLAPPTRPTQPACRPADPNAAYRRAGARALAE